jgi:hypothetical protein
MDFLGSTTPATVIASVQDGVVTTGDSLWPFLLFVGISLAFVIGKYLVSFIRHAVGGRK